MNIQDDANRIKDALQQDIGLKVKLALFGQPGAGKSSIINKLIGRKVAGTGVKTDTTTEKAEYEWNNIILNDLPGYDTNRFPKESYFRQFSILDFDLFLCVFEGKFHETDNTFFQELKTKGKVALFIRNKHDQIWEEGKEIEQLEKEITEDVQRQICSKEKVLFASCRSNYGMSRVSDEIFAHLEPAKKERWARGAKAYSLEFLKEKRDACEKELAFYAVLAATNAINPIPGLDLGVDIGLIIKLFSSIRASYGLTDDRLDAMKCKVTPAVLNLINNLIKYASKDGILLLFKKYASRAVKKQIGKYIPFIGQAIAAFIGYQMVFAIGMQYLEECHEVAQAFLEYELEATNE